MGKGEIARYEQFLLFPQCFQKAWFPGASKDVTVWEWVKDCVKFFKLTGLFEICISGRSTTFTTSSSFCPLALMVLSAKIILPNNMILLCPQHFLKKNGKKSVLSKKPLSMCHGLHYVLRSHHSTTISHLHIFK